MKLTCWSCRGPRVHPLKVGEFHICFGCGQLGVLVRDGDAAALAEPRRGDWAGMKPIVMSNLLRATWPKLIAAEHGKWRA